MPPRSTKPQGKPLTKRGKPKQPLKAKQPITRGSSTKKVPQIAKVQVIHGDCMAAMKKMQSLQYELTFADPPFNIGQKYTGYRDDKDTLEYIQFTEGWLAGVVRVTKSVLCLHGNDNLADLYLSLMKKYTGFKRSAWIIWHYRFGQCNRSNWINSKAHCLIYTRRRTPSYQWNPESVLVDSDRTTLGDKRVHQTNNGGQRLPFDVWGIPSDGPNWGRVQGNNKERVCIENGYGANHPNQLPEMYIARLLKAYTNTGHTVFDPFGGTGTVATVARKLGRNCVTVDVSKQNVDDIHLRLKRGTVHV